MLVDPKAPDMEQSVTSERELLLWVETFWFLIKCGKMKGKVAFP